MTTLRSLRTLPVLMGLASLFVAHVARGQAAPPDRVAAQALFDEGRALYEAGEHDAACAKFAASLRLERAVGTTLNVAECEERHDRLASAWLRYREAESLAASRGDERAAAAAAAAADVARRLGRLRVQAPAGVSVSCDGTPLDIARDGTAIPLDAGSHRLEATADGRQPWRADVVTTNGETTTVVVPELARLPPTPRASPVVVVAPSSSRPPLSAIVLGSVGLGALVAGGVFGVLTITKNAAADDTCSASKNTTADRGDFDPNTGRCYAPSAALDEASALKDDARTFATLANVLVPVGLAGVGIGVYLSLRNRTVEGPTVRVAPSLGGASLEGRF